MPKNSASKTKPRPRSSLSREAIVQAALRVVDEDGLDALTMRRIASELGAGVMSLYVYFRSKEDVIDALADAVLAPIPLDTGSEADWREQIKELMRKIHQTLLAHPGINEIVVAESVPGQALDGTREHALEILHYAGFTTPDALEALGSIYGYVVGFSLLAARDRRHDSGQRPHPIDSAQFPRLASAFPHYDRRTSMNAFEQGLKHLVHGLEPSPPKR